MFDTVQYKGVSYQTKDLENVMATYCITDSGRLFAMGDAFGAEADVSFHGFLNFYGRVGLVWREFTAKFTDGILVNIDITEKVKVLKEHTIVFAFGDIETDGGALIKNFDRGTVLSIYADGDSYQYAVEFNVDKKNHAIINVRPDQITDTNF